MRAALSPRDALRSGLAAAILLILFVVPPWALGRFVGWPLPTRLPHWHEVSAGLNGSTISDAVLIDMLACAAWVAWALFVASAAVEITAWARAVAAPHLVGAGVMQPLVRQLVVSATLVAGTTRAASSATPTHQARTIAVLPIDRVDVQVRVQQPASTTPAEPGPTCLVTPRDSLWRIAERHLGDGLRWRDIWSLNQGTLQPDGRTVRDPNLIRPGWVLRLPSDAIDLSPPTVAAPITQPPTPSSQPKHDTPTPTSTTVRPTTRTGTAPSAPSAETDVDSRSTPSSGQTEATDDDDSFPIPLALAGATLLAAGLVKIVNDLRRRQLEHRTPGHALKLPSADGLHAERLLRAAADAEGADRLDLALRVLGEQLAGAKHGETTRIEAVRVDNDLIEILLTEAVDCAPGPFHVTGGRAWTLPAEVARGDLLPVASHRGCLAPGLVTIGRLQNQQLLIDLEAPDPLILDCDEDSALALMRNLVLDLATHSWADDVRVLAVGTDDVAGSLDRVELIGSLETAASQADLDAALIRAALQELGADSTWSGRLANSGEGWSPTILLLGPKLEAEAVQRILSAAANLGGIGVVAWLPSDEADLFERRIVVGDGRATLLPLGLEFEACGLSAETARATDELLEASLSVEPGELLDPPAVNPPEPHERSSNRTQPVERVLVRIMGPVGIEGGRKPVDRRRVKEFVVLLALHPRGLTESQIKNALWLDTMPTTNAFNQVVSRARTSLGSDERGELFVPYVQDCLYRPGPGLTTDWQELERAWAAVRADPSDPNLGVLRRALDEVRGLPFEGTKGYEWAYEMGIPQRISSIVDEAQQLVASRAPSTLF
jgi:hypothetical protein